MIHNHLQQLLGQLGLAPERPPGADEWRQLLEGLSRRFGDLELERSLFVESMATHWAEMRRLNATLASERDLFARMLQSAPVGIARVLLDGTLSTANPALEALVGYRRHELEGKDALAFVDPGRREAAARLVAELATGQRSSAEGQLRLRHASGSVVYTQFGAAVARDQEGAPQHLILVLVDVTARRNLEVELRHAQKLESVGRLAAGIAHEINTPLQFIGDNTSFLHEAFGALLELTGQYRQACDKAAGAPLDADDQRVLRAAEEAADLAYVKEHVPRAIAATLGGARRVGSIVQSMKSFAHADRGERTAADLNAAIRDTLTVAHNELKYVADVEAEFGELPLVSCCLSDLNQVFLNLLVNAAHAIGEVVKGSGRKGVIRVKTSLEADHVLISVSDTGTGIAEGARSRLFEPFFTTKPVGKGIGQGLAVARSVIVDKHGGSLKFDTELGKGTTFFVRLPLLHAATVSAPAEAPDLKRASGSDEVVRVGAMKRIMFVDDEPNVLEGLRGLLRKQRKEWEMTFVGGGEEALRELLSAPYDVIVSDMRMPGMDGATLLRKVQQDYPHVVRIVLSGQTEQEVSRRMVHVAHQFMSKPCEGKDLQQNIERACKLQALLEHAALRQAVGQIGQLPVKPSVYSRLIQVLEDANSSMADAAAVIEQDVGTSAKLLQVVNSAFFGLSRRVADIKTAVSYLGLEMVKMLALSVEMRQSGSQARPCPGFSLDAVQEHGFLAARIVRRMLPDMVRAQDAFSAAMLADAGVLVLWSRLPELFARIVQQSRETGRPINEVEVEVLGVSHAEVGAYLLGIWGLPYSIVEAVAHCFAPSRAGSSGLDTVTAVHVAKALAEELAPANPATHVGSGVKLELAYLQQLGLADQLPAWRQMARQELGLKAA